MTTKADDPQLDEEEIQPEEEQQELPEGVDEDEAQFAAAFDDNYDESGEPRQENEDGSQEESDHSETGTESSEDNPSQTGVIEGSGAESDAKDEDQEEVTPQPKLKGERPKEIGEAPDSLKKYIEDLENRVRSHVGQLAPVQQQNEDLRKEQETLNDQVKRLAEANKAQQAKLEKWDKYHEEFPDEGVAISEMVNSKVENAVHGVLETVERRLGSQLGDLQSEQARRNRDTEIDRIRSRHPDLEEVTANERFYDWVKAQPKPVQHMVATNIRKNVVAEEMNWVLDQFKSDSGIESRGREVETEATGKAPKRKPRDTSPPSGGSGMRTPKTGAPLDDEQRFAAAFDANYGG